MKKKLDLDELKVKSFVTNFGKDSAETVKGGRPPESNNCESELCPPPDDGGGLSANICSGRYYCYSGTCGISTQNW